MIPLIEREMVSSGWITGREFVDIISVSEMTPGPIAINTATFIGYRIAGIPGGAVATLGVIMPSLILILGISYYLSKFGRRRITKHAIYGIRPVVLALVIQAAVFVAGNIFFKEGMSIISILNENSAAYFLQSINPAAIVIAAAGLAVLLLTKIHPILVILAAGSIGVILHYAGLL